MNQRQKAEPPKAPQEWERFQQFAKRLLAVPVAEVREKQAEQERPAANRERRVGHE